MALRTTEDSIVFACWSKACAPPPAGRGGSIKGGRKGGSVIRKSGGGDSSTTKSVARAGAKALSARFGTKRRGSADRGNTSTKVSKNKAGGVGGSSVGRGPVVKMHAVPKGHVTNATARAARLAREAATKKKSKHVLSPWNKAYPD